jgi:hypothetical protein
MAMSGGQEDGQPMMELNTTPLIDVMLVLLIMFIITIPIQTHAVKVDLPQNSGSPRLRWSRRRTSCTSTRTATCSGTACRSTTCHAAPVSRCVAPAGSGARAALPARSAGPLRRGRSRSRDRQAREREQARLRRQRAVSQRLLIPAARKRSRTNFSKAVPAGPPFFLRQRLDLLGCNESVTQESSRCHGRVTVMQ